MRHIKEIAGVEAKPDTTLEGNPFTQSSGNRSFFVALLCWLLGGWAGLHRLYLGDEKGAQGMLFTFGYCGIGWFLDAFRLGSLVAKANNPDEEVQKTRSIVPLSKEAAGAYCRNRVSNTKYGSSSLEMAIKFVPLSIMEQLERHTNRYFLFIAILQLDPYLTPTHPLTTWGPLGVIFFFTAVRELADDRLRFKLDCEANGRQFGVAAGSAFGAKSAEDIAVGDLVVVKSEEEVPCDLLLLSTSNSDGCAFLNTANLDGEGDLKLKRAVPHTCSLPLVSDPSLASTLEIEIPIQAPHELKGVIKLGDESVPISVTEQQSLPQGSQVMNTEWALGVCLYSGNETRLGRSRKSPSSKRSELDNNIDKISVVVFLAQALIALMLGWVGNVWKVTEGLKEWYLRIDLEMKHTAQFSEFYQPAVIPLRFLLLMSTMIPLSIQVTMDTCKWLYSMWIGWDLQMTMDPQSLEGAHVRNSDVSENLGQVGLVLTDKTGTLTENIMSLKAVTVDGRVYGEPGTEEKRGQIQEDTAIQRAVEGNDDNVINFLRVLALCNSVTTVNAQKASKDVLSTPSKAAPSRKGQGIEGDIGENVTYEACSPDEDALVCSAAALGIKLCLRSTDIMVVDVKGRIEKYQLLRELEFTSDRKRMSVIVMLEGSPVVLVLTKGADEAIRPLLSSGQERLDVETADHIDEFARLGLRTLVVGWKTITREQFKVWENEHLKPATSSFDGREARIAQAYEALEKGLTLIGGTGIEDRLQDGVPQTVRSLRDAGMRIWMVTGDKLSTARQIGISSGMMSAHTAASNVIVCSVPAQVEASIQQLVDATNSRRGVDGAARNLDSGYAESFVEFAVILTGACLAAMTESQKKRFVSGCLTADAVLCCRLTPDQKAELVSLARECAAEIKSLDPGMSKIRRLWRLLVNHVETLGTQRVIASIGDGGNDVAMIQEAHVGIGIVGREGSQAVRASDVSIQAFRDLGRLLLVHGTYCYQRSAVIAQLSFFKSWAFCFGQVFYSARSGFAGTSLYDPFSIAACNALLFLPICFYSLNRPLPMSIAMQRPSLYRVGPMGEHLNANSVSLWLVRAIYQACLSYGITLAVFSASHMSQSGQPPCYTQVSAVSFSIFLVVQCFNLSFETHTFTFLQWVATYGGLAGSLALYAVCNASPKARKLVDYYALYVAFEEPAAQYLVPVVVVASIIPIVASKYWTAQYAAGPQELGRQALSGKDQKAQRFGANGAITPEQQPFLGKGENPSLSA